MEKLQQNNKEKSQYLPKEKKLNKEFILLDEYMENTKKTGNAIHYSPATREWRNSVYSYDKNYTKTIPIADKVVNKNMSAFFNITPIINQKKSKRIQVRHKRLSLNKILVSRAEMKHTNDKVVVSVFYFNQTKKTLLHKLSRLNKNLLYSVKTGITSLKSQLGLPKVTGLFSDKSNPDFSYYNKHITKTKINLEQKKLHDIVDKFLYNNNLPQTMKTKFHMNYSDEDIYNDIIDENILSDKINENNYNDFLHENIFFHYINENLYNDINDENICNDNINDNIYNDIIDEKLFFDLIDGNILSDNLYENIRSDKKNENLFFDKINGNIRSDNTNENLLSDITDEYFYFDLTNGNIKSDNIYENLLSDKKDENLISDKINENIRSDNINKNTNNLKKHDGFGLDCKQEFDFKYRDENEVNSPFLSEEESEEESEDKSEQEIPFLTDKSSGDVLDICLFFDEINSSTPNTTNEKSKKEISGNHKKTALSNFLNKTSEKEIKIKNNKGKAIKFKIKKNLKTKRSKQKLINQKHKKKTLSNYLSYANYTKAKFNAFITKGISANLVNANTKDNIKNTSIHAWLKSKYITLLKKYNVAGKKLYNYRLHTQNIDKTYNLNILNINHNINVSEFYENLKITYYNDISTPVKNDLQKKPDFFLDLRQKKTKSATLEHLTKKRLKKILAKKRRFSHGLRSFSKLFNLHNKTMLYSQKPLSFSHINNLNPYKKIILNLLKTIKKTPITQYFFFHKVFFSILYENHFKATGNNDNLNNISHNINSETKQLSLNTNYNLSSVTSSEKRFNSLKQLFFINLDISNFSLVYFQKKMKSLAQNKDNLSARNSLFLNNNKNIMTNNNEMQFCSPVDSNIIFNEKNSIETLMDKRNVKLITILKNKCQNIFLEDVYEKHLLYLNYIKALAFNNTKFKIGFLHGLKNTLSTIYKKKVEFNLVNLKYLYLNSDIFSESIFIKLKKRKNRYPRVLRKALSIVAIKKRNPRNIFTPLPQLYNFVNKSISNFNRLTDNLDFSTNNHTNNHDNIALYENLTHNNDSLQSLIYKLFNGFISSTSMFSNKTVNTLKSKYLSKIQNIVLDSVKHKAVFGVKLETAGRLSKRFTASRSIFKQIYLGSLFDINSTRIGLSSTMLRGHIKSNLQYTGIKGKTRNGAYGLKNWVSTY